MDTFNLTKSLKKGGGNIKEDNTDVIRLVKDAFAQIFKEVYLYTTGGTEIESNNFVGHVSTIMRVQTSKHGDLSSEFDEIYENFCY